MPVTLRPIWNEVPSPLPFDPFLHSSCFPVHHIVSLLRLYQRWACLRSFVAGLDWYWSVFTSSSSAHPPYFHSGEGSGPETSPILLLQRCCLTCWAILALCVCLWYKPAYVVPCFYWNEANSLHSWIIPGSQSRSRVLAKSNNFFKNF